MSLALGAVTHSAIAETQPAAASPAPASAPAPAAAPCAQTAKSWTKTGPWDTQQYGNYFVSNDNFNNTPGQKIWANSEHCFGVTTSATVERSGVGSYPHVVRGWMQNEGDMRSQSTPGTLDWPIKSGMGIPVARLNKAKIHWAFTASTTPGSRWMALIDVYFHKTAMPNANEFPPATDLMINQSIMDQPIASHSANTASYYAYTASVSHPFTVTLGGNKYLVYIDNPGEVGFHQTGGHTIHLFQMPTTFTDGSGVNWGAASATTDLAAIVKYFMQASPKDDAGRPVQTAGGTEVNAPLIQHDLMLNAINAGWEIDVGTSFQTNEFWIAMQNEPDGG
jgi:hypothetical protein